jgi:hypothetical protein
MHLPEIRKQGSPTTYRMMAHNVGCDFIWHFEERLRANRQTNGAKSKPSPARIRNMARNSYQAKENSSRPKCTE